MNHELTIKVPFKKIEETIERLNEAGIYNLHYEVPIEITTNENGYGFYEKENAIIDLNIYFDEDNTSIEDFMEILINRLHINKNDIESSQYEEIEYEFKLDDIDLGNNWIISYSLKEYPNKNVLFFEPQAAFGTGLHETTQECLRIILKHDFSRKSVLDLGTGSGILSIAAAVKGAEAVEAVDIEPVEREIQENARLNRVHQLQIMQADLLEGNYIIKGSYDWVFLNIGAKETLTILDRHGLFNKNIENFLISGIVDWNYESIMDIFERNNYSVIEKHHANSWVTIHFKK